MASAKAQWIASFLAAAEEFRPLGITVNVINPGPTDTGWMTSGHKTHISQRTIGERWGKRLTVRTYSASYVHLRVAGSMGNYSITTADTNEPLAMEVYRFIGGFLPSHYR